MKKYCYLSYFLLLTSIALPLKVYAMYPVIDVTEIAKTAEVISQLKEEIDHIKKLKEVADGQLNFLQQNLQGNFKYGDLLNKQEDLDKRQWSDNSWEEVLSMEGSGKSQAFTEVQKKYADLYNVVDAKQIGGTLQDKDLTRKYYNQGKEVNRAALAGSSYSYDQVNEHIQNVHDILAMLEKKTSEKAAIDLNARLIAELCFIQLESLKQQNMQTQVTATYSQGLINGMSDQSNFMK